jgi:hypothetical protein
MTRRGSNGQIYGEHSKSSSYYVYFHRNPSTGEIFYIGMGRFNRCNQRVQRNRYWKNYVRKHGVKVSIEFSGMSKKEALCKEIQLIREHRPKCNLTQGGEGGGLTPKGVTAFSCDGQVVGTFPSIVEANLWAGISYRDSRIYRCLKGQRKKLKGLVWVTEGSPFPGKPTREKMPALPVHQYSLCGKYLASYERTSCAKVPNRTGIYTALDSGRTYAGFFWRSQKTDAISVKVPTPALQARKPVKCTLTGKTFDSVTEAARHVGIRHQSLSKMLRGKLKNRTTLNYE